MTPIHHQIKYHRIARGLTQRELGDAIGQRQNYVSELEAGKRFPQHSTLLAIAEALECELVLAEKKEKECT